jgi:hypothetical protein
VLDEFDSTEDMLVVDCVDVPLCSCFALSLMKVTALPGGHSTLLSTAEGAIFHVSVGTEARLNSVDNVCIFEKKRRRVRTRRREDDIIHLHDHVRDLSH